MDSLPIRVAPFDDEAGLGFIYRSLAANGLSIKEAQHWLQLRTLVPMADAELPIWSWIIGAERTWLRERVVISNHSKGGANYGFMRHRLGSGIAALFHSARICPMCIKRERRHRLSWQLVCIPGCAIHEVILMDSCAHCGQILTWNRPAVDVCHCGRFLTAAEIQTTLSPALLSWIRWIEARLLDIDGITSPRDYGLPDLFRDLSIDGCQRVASAAGLLPDAESSPGAPSKKCKTSLGMAEVLARGIDRLSRLAPDFSNLADLQPVLHIPAIERLRTVSIVPADHSIADMLLGHTPYLPFGDIPGPGLPRRRQKMLF